MKNIQNLLIVENNFELANKIKSYCKKHFNFKETDFSDSISKLQVKNLQNTFFMLNANLIIDSNELVSMAQLIRKYHVPILLYFQPDQEDVSCILDSIELGAIDIISSSIFDEDEDIVSNSEQKLFDSFIKALLKKNFSFDVDLLRFRLSPFAIEIKKIFSSKKSIVLIGADFGGIPSILGLMPKFNSNYPHPICVLMNGHEIILKDLTDRLSVNCELNVHYVDHETKIQQGTIYIIPANKTPIIDQWDKNTVKILVNDSLPFEMSLKHWIDPFMFTAVDVYGKNTTGILLSGIQEDGIIGLEKIAAVRGKTFIQIDKTSALSQRLELIEKRNLSAKKTYLNDLAQEIIKLG